MCLVAHIEQNIIQQVVFLFVASLFLISGVLSMQMESTISEFLMKQLTSVDVGDRAKAVER